MFRQAVTEPVSRFVERKAPPVAESSPLEQAVLRAVTYASLFQFPLTPAELRRTVVGHSISDVQLMSLYRASPFLQDRIDYRRGHFVPVGCDDWINERSVREVRSLRFIHQHERFLDVLCALPGVSLLSVSGSLAHLNATANADLDLFIVTKGARVWSVTLAVVLLAKLMGVRKTVCANFVVADTDLAVEPQDEFCANQIIHLRPITGSDTYRAFVDANPFVRAIYPNFDPREKTVWPFRPAAWTPRTKRALELALAIPAGAIEWTSRVTYGWYLRRHVRRWASPDQVRLTRTQLKLHGNSHRQSIAHTLGDAMRRAGL